jgi:hypothetical protein
VLKQSFKYAYNINQNRSYMQPIQITLYNSSQGSSPGLPRGLFAPGAVRGAPGAPWRAPWDSSYRSTIEATVGMCSGANRLSPASPTTPHHRESLELQGNRGLPRDQRYQDSTGSHRQALVNNCPRIIPGHRNLVY